MWVALLRGLSRGEELAGRVHSTLLDARERGRVRVPLAASHYLETWHRSQERSRDALAGLMRDVSRYATLADVHRMERAGIEWHIARRAGQYWRVHWPPSIVFGTGVNHAFDSPTGRFRMVASVATGSTDEGEPLSDPEELLAAGRRGGDRWEWLNLAGTQELLESGIEVRSAHRIGRRAAADETELRLMLAEDPGTYRRVADLLVAQAVHSNLDVINAFCEQLDLDPRSMLGDPEGMRTFVRRVPVSNVEQQLRLHRLRDPGFPIEEHDQTDFSALALAVPYCDVVVTERRWSHALRQARLDRWYGTTLCSTLAELDAWLRDHVRA